MMKISAFAFITTLLALTPALGSGKIGVGLGYHLIPSYVSSSRIVLNNEVNKLNNDHPLHFSELSLSLNDDFDSTGWGFGLGLIYGNSNAQDIKIKLGSQSDSAMTISRQNILTTGARVGATKNFSAIALDNRFRTNPFISASTGYLNIHSDSELSKDLESYSIQTRSSYLSAKFGGGLRIINTDQFYTKVEAYTLYQRPLSIDSNVQKSSASGSKSSQSGKLQDLEAQVLYGIALHAGGHF